MNMDSKVSPKLPSMSSKKNSKLISKNLEKG
jgi:hypothetical protein